MRNRMALISLLMFELACDTRHVVPESPDPPPQLWLNIRTITVGETVGGDLPSRGSVNEFEFTAPASGTFVATVNWTGTDGRIEMQVEKKVVASSTAPQFDGRFVVAAGQLYHVLIADGSPWDYDDFRATYTLATAIEPTAHS
jgi:hypothetical protein